MSNTKNDNCLYGMKCPKCGSLEPFMTIARVAVLVFDDGTENLSSHVEYEDGALWRCEQCRYEDTVGYFILPVDESAAESSEDDHDLSS